MGLCCSSVIVLTVSLCCVQTLKSAIGMKESDENSGLASPKLFKYVDTMCVYFLYTIVQVGTHTI